MADNGRLLDVVLIMNLKITGQHSAKARNGIEKKQNSFIVHVEFVEEAALKRYGNYAANSLWCSVSVDSTECIHEMHPLTLTEGRRSLYLMFHLKHHIVSLTVQYVEARRASADCSLQLIRGDQKGANELLRMAFIFGAGRGDHSCGVQITS
ncbi:hypothetical protein AXG93_2294s1050 [Marchantia polymorpha subsp. ruderalis]|uniref:Uncharacterized protein n=1 Tax=Marchantia polymorpha subsp. ruderalis TaxID=1480154 RepID=A0A176WEF6_MARPO|nr:hypothetical protein AXG93_2294s1050 [Marchantia polymorpha subsp. ruderalis]